MIKQMTCLNGMRTTTVVNIPVTHVMVITEQTASQKQRRFEMNVKGKASGSDKDYVRRQLQDLVAGYGLNTVYYTLSQITTNVMSTQEASSMIGGPKGSPKQAKEWRKVVECLVNAADQINEEELTEGPNRR